jgi:hypothetical protein
VVSEPEIKAGHETTDANPRLILWVAAGMIVSAIVIHIAVGMYEYGLGRWYSSPLPASRITVPRQTVPPPQLQTSPSLDWEEYRSASEAQLRTYGWVNRDAGTIRIPIERAMELTAQRGLPARAPTPAPTKKEVTP